MASFGRRGFLWVIGTALLISISTLAGWATFYELFIEELGVNVPRVTLGTDPSITGSATTVRFNVDVPTVGSAVILLSACLCISTSARILWELFRFQVVSRPQRRFTVIIMLLLTQLITYGIMLDDMFSSAGDFG